MSDLVLMVIIAFLLPYLAMSGIQAGSDKEAVQERIAEIKQDGLNGLSIDYPIVCTSNNVDEVERFIESAMVEVRKQYKEEIEKGVEDIQFIWDS